MKEAELSFAMKNAHPLVVEAANFQTQLSNAEHGVSEILRKIALA